MTALARALMLHVLLSPACAPAVLAVGPGHPAASSAPEAAPPLASPTLDVDAPPETVVPLAPATPPTHHHHGHGGSR